MRESNDCLEGIISPIAILKGRENTDSEIITAKIG
jgi:hypothetical protein